MAISKKMQDAFIKQINAEFYSAYLYLSMASYFESINLDGFANWMRVQTQEEITHGMKMYTFVNERGGHALMKGIDAPPTEWADPLDAFKEVLAHEEKVTALINALMSVAEKENDRAAMIFLQWFITEQIEEEKNAGDIISKLTLMKSAPGGLFMIDRELAQRVFVPPAPTGAAAT